MPVLPLDIWSLVIDGFTPDTIPVFCATLRACALTCQDWLSRARYRLYYEIFLHDKEGFILLSRTLTESPKLGALVHEIHFVTSPFRKRASSTLRGRLSADSNPIPFTPYAIGQLINLHCLSIDAHPEQSIPASFLPFIRTFATCRTLEILRLQQVQFSTYKNFLRTIWSFPGISELQVYSCSWSTEGVAPLEERCYTGHCRNLSKLEVRSELSRPHYSYLSRRTTCLSAVVP